MKNRNYTVDYKDYLQYEDQVIKGFTVKQCKEYPNYGVSYCGRVFRLDSRTKMTANLRGIPEYWNIRLSHNGVAKNVRLHILIALVWVPNSKPETHNVVNHIDGDKLNNAATNLEWTTNAKNQQHGRTLEGNYGSGLYNASFSDDMVHTLCSRLVDGARVVDLAKEYNVSRDALNKLKTGSTFFHIRKLYEVPHNFKNTFSPETVHWVCERINEGLGDINIAKASSNTKMTPIEVKRIRHKIRYTDISNMYF